MYATHSAATDPKADAIPYVVTPEIAQAADQGRPWLEWTRNNNNARDWGTPRPPKPEGCP